MKFKRIAVYSVFLLFILAISSNSVLAACSTTPIERNVFSGFNFLGNKLSDSRVYIHSDLDLRPLKIEFVFENQDANCYEDNTDMKFRLIPTGVEVFADTLSNTLNSESGKTISKFTFNFRIEDFEFNTLLRSTYSITPSDGNQALGSITFDSDEEDPLFLVNIEPRDRLIRPGQAFEFQYVVSDVESGLDRLIVSGGTSDLFNFENDETSVEINFSHKPSSSTSYFFNVRDKIGRETTEEISVVVDNTAPIITNIEKIYTFDNKQKVTIIATIEDDSFEIIEEDITVTADFSQINPTASSVQGDCTRNEDSTQTCIFRDIIITLGQTSEVNLLFDLEDELGNVDSVTRREEIIVDNEGPIIEEFFLENSNGVENLLSSNDFGVTVNLKFRDISLVIGGNPRIIENFGSIPLTVEECIIDGEVATCKWELGNSVSIYSNLDSFQEEYSLTVVDFYGNSRSSSIDVEIDNKEPIINNIFFEETESIKDGVIKSQERVNFIVEISDDNLFSNGFFVTGDFSNVDFRTGLDELEASCSSTSTNTTTCTFNGVKVENGFMKRDVIFQISDAAANTVEIPFEVEVLRVGDESFSAFNIRDIDITNPINRNRILKNSVNAWFEGRVENIAGSGIEIINYQLQGCDFQGFDPLIIIDFSLFPDNLVINEGQDDLEDFAIKMELKNHGNINDLNTKTTSCTMSVLKKDNEQIYPPELVNFTLELSFFDVPRQNLIDAHAQKILDMTTEVEYLGGWFDSIYDIYSVLNTICSLAYQGGGVINQVSEAYALFSFLFSGATLGVDGGSFTIAGDSAQTGIFTSMSDFLHGSDGKPSPFKIACSMITCENGGPFGEAIGGFVDESTGGFLSEIQEFQTNICSGDFTSAKAQVGLGDGTSS